MYKTVAITFDIRGRGGGAGGGGVVDVHSYT